MILYKFLDTKKANKFIENQRLYFTPPIFFNDLQDCSACIDISEILCKKNTKEYLRYVRRFYNRYLQQNPFERITLQKFEEKLQKPNFIKRIFENDINNKNLNIREILSNMYVICSLSEFWSENLMWSHYASKHKGICIGINFDDQFIKSMINKKVKYVSLDEKPIVPYLFLYKIDDEKQRKILRKVIFTKTTNWKYEDEFRFLSEKDYCKQEKRVTEEGKDCIYYYKQLKIDTIKEIYIGANSNYSLKTIQDWKKKFNKDINFYKIVESLQSYKLDRKIL